MQFVDIRELPARALVLTDGWHRLEKAGDGFSGAGVDVLLQREGEGTKVLLNAQTPVRAVALRWDCDLTEPVRLMGDHWERAYGDMAWHGIVPDRYYPWYVLMNDGRVTHGYGVMTGCNAFCHFLVTGDSIDLVLDVRCGGEGVRLGSRTLHAATIVARRGSEGESAFSAGRALCRMMCPAPRLPAAPVYGSNNWYYAYGNSSHAEILGDTALLSELTEGLENRPFMVIDDGWQVEHNDLYNGGPWDRGNADFPDMAQLAGEIRARGARPGIWMRPLFYHQEQYRPLILLNGVGRGDTPCLDPTIPEAMQIVREDVARIAAWGYTLIKHDFSTFDLLGRWGREQAMFGVTGGGWTFHDQSVTTAEVVLQLYRTIREAAGSAYIIGCNTFSHLSAGLFELERTGDDTSGRDWRRTKKYGVNTVAFRAIQHDTFYAADGDCVGLTNDVPWELNRQWLTLLARSGTPLFVSADPKAMGAEQKKAVREAYAIASQPQPLGEPLDWMDNTCPKLWKFGADTVQFRWTDESAVESDF